jgi:hypothetical protein
VARLVLIIITIKIPFPTSPQKGGAGKPTPPAVRSSEIRTSVYFCRP